MSLEETDLIIARLEGFLKAFEWLNHKANHGCRFAVFKLPKSATIAEALAGRFGLASSKFQIESLGDFVLELRTVLGRFLFLFQEEFGDSLVDPSGSFTIMHDWGRSDLLDDLLSDFMRTGITGAWRVIPGKDCEELREWCYQDDLVVGYPGGYLLLHLGVSD